MRFDLPRSNPFARNEGRSAKTEVKLRFDLPRSNPFARNEGRSANGLLQECMEAVRAGNACLRTLFSRGVFLSNSDAGFAGEMGMKFLRRFASLAHKCRVLGRMLFPLQPKGHTFHHIVLELVLAASRDNRSHIVNPLAWSCQADEDFVGRPSRVSRRVRPGKIQVRRVIQRYLKGAYCHWIKSKLVCRAART